MMTKNEFMNYEAQKVLDFVPVEIRDILSVEPVTVVKMNDQKPYLESHHIIWLSDGGDDSIENTVALCPNCHRKMHVVNDPKDVKLLKEKKTK